MALEDRVKQLEDELKVLKNEIQTTLLDIQEQILSHYYPALYPMLNAVSQPFEPNFQQEQSNQVSAQPNVQQQQPYQASTPVNGIYSKYKTKTITLIEDADEDADEDEDESMGHYNAPSNAQSMPRTEPVEPRKQDNNYPIESTKNKDIDTLSVPTTKSIRSENRLADDNDQFLENLLKEANVEKELSDTSFDEFSDLFQNKEKQTKHEVDQFTGKMLDELFNESFPFLEPATKKEEAQQPTSNPLNSEAVKVTVKKLLTWIDESIAAIGKDRAQQAVDMYVRAGDLSPMMRIALIELIKSNREHPVVLKANIREIINTLGKLNDILDHHTPEYLDDVMKFIKEVNFG